MSLLNQAFVLILLYIDFSYCDLESHFVIDGSPSQEELDDFIKTHRLNYRSHGCFGPNMHYFITKRSGENLLKLYEHAEGLPWVRTVDHQHQFPLEKRARMYQPNSAQFKLVSLPNDDEYRLIYKGKAGLLRDQLNFNDPNAPLTWQLLNDGNPSLGKNPGVDINVYPVYAANITGRGAVGIVVDDALDTQHEDLMPNINFEFLADLVNNTRADARGTDAKMPSTDDHGTEVAGLFAAVANNSRCAFGVAHGATIGAVRLLGEKVTDYMVGEALSLFSENASLYISSWGPNDDGKTMRSPGKFMNSAFKHTGTKGNHGRGSVFVFATGNGGAAGDNCGADGFINHPRVIGVSAISENGLPPVYGERCSAVSISVPVGGASDRLTFMRQVATKRKFVSTTKINNMCTSTFVGTSASDPMAAGVIALAMEVNPDLTPRDVSAIIALSGRIPTASAADIDLNGAGYLVSHTYGSGLLNALRMVKLAKHWVPLGEQQLCVNHLGTWTKGSAKNVDTGLDRKIYAGRSTDFKFNFNETDCGVEVVEMVRVGLQWTADYRGATEVTLKSPSGQIAYLLLPRPRDRYAGRSEMIWKSLLHTGERALGDWVVKVRDTGMRSTGVRPLKSRPSGSITFVGMEISGTTVAGSAFEQNKDQIVKHWHPVRLEAHYANKAVKLDQELLSDLYDRERWHMIREAMED